MPATARKVRTGRGMVQIQTAEGERVWVHSSGRRMALAIVAAILIIIAIAVVLLVTHQPPTKNQPNNTPGPAQPGPVSVVISV